MHACVCVSVRMRASVRVRRCLLMMFMMTCQIAPQDLRKETVATTFGGHMDSVRDVQFNPHHYFMFASAYENGNIQVAHSL